MIRQSPLGCSGSSAKKSRRKRGEERCSELSTGCLEVAILMVHSRFNQLFSSWTGPSKQSEWHPWSIHSGKSGLSWMPFWPLPALESPPQTALGFSGRCGSLDGFLWCRQGPLQDWPKRANVIMPLEFLLGINTIECYCGSWCMKRERNCILSPQSKQRTLRCKFRKRNTLVTQHRN